MGVLPDKLGRTALVLACAGVGLACSPAEEPARVEVPVVVDGSLLVPHENDLGYDVELSEARLVVQDLTFAVAGETHRASLWDRLSDLVVAPARAHPGHVQGGDVTGQLRGRFLIDWSQPGMQEIGAATLLVGSYDNANFIFARAQPSDVSEGDALLEHTARLVGVARKDGVEVPFEVTLTAPSERELIGVPCRIAVEPDSALRLAFQFNPIDEIEGETIFDAVDFAALPRNGEGVVELDDSTDDASTREALNQIQRTFQTHDHFIFETKDAH